MFGRQADRLLKKFWANPFELAQELFAMMQDSVPQWQTGPMTFLQPRDATDPAVTIRTYDGAIPPLRFEAADGTLLGSIDRTGTPLTPTGEARSVPSGSRVGVSTTTTPAPSEQFCGTVVSGTGDTYVCNLYSDAWTTVILESGLPKDFTVKVGQIDPAETIAAGTKMMVGLRGGQYFMQVPVWA